MSTERCEFCRQKSASECAKCETPICEGCRVTIICPRCNEVEGIVNDDETRPKQLAAALEYISIYLRAIDMKNLLRIIEHYQAGRDTAGDMELRYLEQIISVESQGVVHKIIQLSRGRPVSIDVISPLMEPVYNFKVKETGFRMQSS